MPIASANVFMPGQYTVPFQFVLPTHMTGSCEVGTDPQKNHFRPEEAYHWAKTGVHISACATVNGSEKDSFETEVSVIQPPPPAKARVREDKKSVGCCCANYGDIHIKMETVSDSYKVGDPILVRATFTNNSSKKINNIDLEFVRVMRLYGTQRTYCEFDEKNNQIWKTYNNKCKDSKELAYSSVRTITSMSLDGVKPKDTVTREFALRVPQDAKDLVASTEGKHVKISYELQTIGKASCVNSNPEVAVPVTMYTEPVVFPKPIRAGWAPTQLPQVGFFGNFNLH